MSFKLKCELIIFYAVKYIYSVLNFISESLLGYSFIAGSSEERESAKKLGKSVHYVKILWQGKLELCFTRQFHHLSSGS